MFTLLVPGIESGWPASAPRLPALERLLARARLQPFETGPWSVLARLAGGDVDAWPIAPVSALAELPHATDACLRLEPLGAGAEEQGIFRLPATALGITCDEAEALASAFREVFATEGLRLAIASPERWYLLIDAARWPSLQWRGFGVPAGSLAAGARPAPPEPALRLLLSEVEMLFHAHPVNEARRAQGAPTIAGLHPWGGGRLDTTAPESAGIPWRQPLPEEPYLGGLRRLGVVGDGADGPGEVQRPDGVDEPGRRGGQAGRGARSFAREGVAWPVAAESIGHASWERVESEWAEPLLRALLRGRLGGIRIVTARAVHETSRFAALRFWRRPRPVEQLC